MEYVFSKLNMTPVTMETDLTFVVMLLSGKNCGFGIFIKIIFVCDVIYKQMVVT